MAAPKQITALIKRFDEQRETYQHASYNETQVRREFIDPLFKALGWDIDNTGGKPQAYKDVIHEDAIKVGGLTKAPDYCFRTGGDRKFFVEAKKPAVPLSTHQDSAFQLKRYAWSAQLPLGILTDFEEIVVYDCRIRPKQGDPVTKARLHYFRYDELPERWQEFSDLFSRKSVENGSLDEFTKAKARGSATVDKEFLKEIERWRELLAKNIAVRNDKLTTEQLNQAVQRTIDRLVFLRICEDRGIESYGRLQALLNSSGTYHKLTELFRYADKRYNSGLFHFEDEREQASPPDVLSLALKIDDEPLQDIIRHLYYPESPYEFSVLPTEILGQVYEQFLGKVIRLTAGHRAKIEEKPEVRKAGGVYYTPRYIVDYIVGHTVGELVKGKKPAQVAKLKVLDPACGSGSFLLGAYQYLLDWHRDWYVSDDPKKHARGKNPKLYRAAGEEWRLTAPEKRRILLNNIHGVDIDAQAVEVTKLSLLLKVLEDVSGDALQQQFGVLQKRALPDLGSNIKCGNSLIGHDYFEGQMLPDDEEYKRINPFDWEDEFLEIMRGGGFDAVIGNPPYGAVFTNIEKRYFAKTYTSQNYQAESYLLFLERSLRRLKLGGYYGMIIPNTWLTNIFQSGARKFVVNKSSIKEIVHFRYHVFPKVTIDNEIVILQRGFVKKNSLKVKTVDAVGALESPATLLHDQSKWVGKEKIPVNIFLSEGEERLREKIHANSEKLDSLFSINVGIKPYQKGKGRPAQTRKEVQNRSFDADKKVNKTYRLYLRGSDLQPYLVKPLKQRFISYGPWLAEPRPAANFDAPIKILVRQTGDSIIAALDDKQRLCLNNVHVLVPDKKLDIDIYAVLGVLNSKLMTWCYRSSNPETGEALAEVKKTHVANLPIVSSKQYATLSENVRKLVNELEKIEDGESRRIKYLKKSINQSVYKIYGLTDTEIKAVEKQS